MVAGKLPGLGGLAERVQRGRYEWHHGYIFVYEQGQQLRNVESRHQQQGSSQREYRVQDHIEAVDVIEREETESYIVAGNLAGMRCDELENVGDQVGVRKHHALGKAGGAAGVGKRRDSMIGGLIGGGPPILNRL